MNLANELKSFIEQKFSTRALLLTGQWGCGKTYFLKDFANTLKPKKQNEKQKSDANDNNEYIVGIVSLFGINSVETLHNAVYEEYKRVGFSNFNKFCRGALKKISETVKVGTQIAGTVCPEANILGNINATLSLDFKDIIKVEKYYDKAHRKQFVLIFDDLERCKINMIDLLGAINYYVETKDIKTIIVADESHIKEEKDTTTDKTPYGEFKEKLIERTLEFQPQYEEIIDCIIKSFSSGVDYFKFLDENSDTIKKIFFEEGSNNLRSIKTILNTFSRIFNVVNGWKNEHAQAELKNLFYNYAILYYYSVNGYLNKTNEDECLEYNKRFSEINPNYFFASLVNYIEKGYLDDKGLIFYYKIMCYKKLDSYSKFLNDSLINLDQEIIDKHFETVLMKAYEGNASLYEYNRLIQIINLLNKYEPKYLDKVDVERLQVGLNKRWEKIRDFKVTDNSFDGYRVDFSAIPELKEFVNYFAKIVSRVDSYYFYDELLKDISGNLELENSNYLNHQLPTLDERFVDAVVKCVKEGNSKEIFRVSSIVLRMNLKNTYDKRALNYEDTLEALENTKNKIKQYYDECTDCVKKYYIDGLLVNLDQQISQVQKI